MNIVTYIRQYAFLIGLVIVLIVAFLLKTAPVRDLAQSTIGVPTEPLKTLTPVTVANEVNDYLRPKPDTPARSVSIANVASSISHAIESRFNPKVMPLPNFSSMVDVKTKKLAFFNYLNTLAQTGNEKIIQLRTEIQRINPQRLTSQQQQRLKRLSKSYKIKTKEPAEQINLLLRKINIIPQALVLAQAANESAWGTSRFATEGNNLFGQWCFSLGCGLIPSGRPEGATYEVRKFKDPQASVDAYIRNLNSHASYKGLRDIRICLITNGDFVSARALSAGLKSYSTRGVEYIDDIRSMIRTNNLEPWQQKWWGDDNKHPCSELVQLVRPAVSVKDPVGGLTTLESK
ncbi:MAG: glucosaminidase domain-containing protein [Oceanospirillaceae bacterium]|nr:glucosaminidase domain-containing protein [Oceanospirillaceae bacterium]